MHCFNRQLHKAHVVAVDTLRFSSVVLTAGRTTLLLNFNFFTTDSVLYTVPERTKFALIPGGSCHTKMAGLLLVSFRRYKLQFLV